MWKQDILEMLELWGKNHLIESIRVNLSGDIIIKDTRQKLYIYSNGEIKELAE